jgi:hypothetical protein
MNIASVARASHAYGLRVLHFYVLILPSFYIINFFLLRAHLHELAFCHTLPQKALIFERGIHQGQKIASSMKLALDPGILKKGGEEREEYTEKLVTDPFACFGQASLFPLYHPGISFHKFG